MIMNNRLSLIHIFICNIIAAPTTVSASNIHHSNAFEKEACRILIDKGEQAFKQRNFDIAMQKYRAASEMCPSPELYFVLAQAYFKIDQCSDAHSALLKISETQLTTISPSQYRALTEEVVACNNNISYKFKAFKSINDIDIELNYKVTVGQENCTTPCNMRLKPGETLVGFEDLYSQRVQLNPVHSVVVFSEKKSSFVKYSGLAFLSVGVLTVGIGVIFLASPILSTSNGLTIEHPYWTAGWPILATGVVLSTLGSIAIARGNKKTTSIKASSL